MRRLVKRGMTVSLILAFLAALVACSNGNNKEGSPSGTSSDSPGIAGASWQQGTPGSGGQALPVTQKLAEYTFMARELGGVPFRDSFVVLPELEKRTNVKLNLNKVPESNYNDKLSVVLASGAMPDLIAGVNLNVANRLAEMGLHAAARSDRAHRELRDLVVERDQAFDDHLALRHASAAPRVCPGGFQGIGAPHQRLSLAG